MKKLLVTAVLAFTVIGLAKLLADKQEPADRPTTWDKLKAQMELMPEDFPPRVMFDNVAATKVNTERILEILGSEEPLPEELVGVGVDD